MEAGLNVVWLVMDNAAFGTIAGLEQMHYGTTFGCVFECNGQPLPGRFRGDGPRLGRARRDGAVGRRARARRCARHSACGRPAVVQVPMENAPTPTPGYWNINDIYRKGE